METVAGDAATLQTQLDYTNGGGAGQVDIGDHHQEPLAMVNSSKGRWYCEYISN